MNKVAISIALLLAFSATAYSQAITDPVKEAQRLTRVAQVAQQQGRFDDAIVVTKNSLKVAEQATGPNHPNMAMSLNNLAERDRAYRTASQCRRAAEEPAAGRGDG